MNKDTFLTLYDDVQRFLRERKLADALRSAKGMAACSGQWEAAAILEDADRSYSMLLDYMENGYEDAERARMVKSFFRVVSEQSTSLRRDFEIKETDSHYAATWRTLQHMKTAGGIDDLRRADTSGRQLFEVVWTSDVWSQDDLEAVREAVGSSAMAWHNKCIVLSAVMLGCLYFFDARKVELLSDFAQHSDVVCRVRALVGLVLVYVQHHDLLDLYPKLQARMQLMGDDRRLIGDLRDIQFQLFLSLGTQDVEKQLRENILPEIMKCAKDFRRENPEGRWLGTDEGTAFGLNPEWGIGADGNSRLTENMRKLAEMQQKGADIFIGQFKLLKQKYPFFSVAANWFSPFYFEHPEIASTTGDNAFLKRLFAAKNLCDSDKFSFCLMLKTMPASLRDRLGQQFAEMATEETAGTSSDAPTDTCCVIRTYVQDLYRFFKLFRRRDEHIDPFRQNLLLPDYPLFKDWFSDATVMRRFADFVFDDKSYLLARKLYEMLPATAEICQRIGFCCQQVQDYDGAIAAYERAGLLAADSAWALRQQVFCHRKTGNADAAARCYQALLCLCPDDAGVLQGLGECYIHLQRYDEAFALLYKANYLGVSPASSYRALGWCSLATGRYEQACGYYDKLLTLNPTAVDFLNAGHAAWLKGDIAAGVAHYRKSLSVSGKEYAADDFFAEDADLLEKQGKTSEDLRLMTDILNRGK